MKTIKCSCGEEILILPNLKAMVTALKAHEKKHPHSELELTQTLLLEA
jgi:hypothetical protein